MEESRQVEQRPVVDYHYLLNTANYTEDVPPMATNSGILVKSTTPTFSDDSCANANRLTSLLLSQSISNTPANFPPLYDHTRVRL